MSHVSCLPSPVSRLPSPVSRLPSPVSRLPSPVSRLPSPVSRLPSPVSRLPSPVSRLLSANIQTTIGAPLVYFSVQASYESIQFQGLHRRRVSVPCKPGLFLPVDKQRCRPCPINSFQGAYGATQCLPCPRHLTTLADGAKSDKECLGPSGSSLVRELI